MLSQLHIENIAVIERASIEFGPGLNVLTGETGAGKSILIDSINAVLGSRASRELIRHGEEKARVTAMFTDISEETLARLDELGYPADEDGCLLIQREISRTGKGYSRINGVPCTVSMLKDVGLLLINMHGQHENQALLNVDMHLAYLDKAGGLAPDVAVYSAAYRKTREIYRKYQALNLDESEKERRIDLLRYQINEIEGASPRPGELDELRRSRDFYANSERIASAVTLANEQLEGGFESSGAADRLSAAADALEQVARFSGFLTETADRLKSLYYELSDAASGIKVYLGDMEYDPAEQERVEERLVVLDRLRRKYGDTEADILAYRKTAADELENIELADEKRLLLKKEYDAQLEQTERIAQQLTEKRKQAAAALSGKIRSELSYLGMERVVFTVDMKKAALSQNGWDDVEFLMSTNPGEIPKSISKIASGGELSRIMLAIKNVLAQNDDIGTLIFDEIDAGISGEAARKVGKKLRDISGCRQVICVTHLAQIAAFGHRHFFIEKTVKSGRTYTVVTELGLEQRKYELARIMHGSAITDTMLSGAAELLAASGR